MKFGFIDNWETLQEPLIVRIGRYVKKPCYKDQNEVSHEENNCISKFWKHLPVFLAGHSTWKLLCLLTVKWAVLWHWEDEHRLFLLRFITSVYYVKTGGQL